MMKLIDAGNRTYGRDSMGYILNFIIGGGLVFGIPVLVLSVLSGYTPVYLYVTVAVSVGALSGWLVGSLFDIKKEIRYRHEIREKMKAELRESPGENHNLIPPM